MTINRGPRGERRIVTVRPDHSRVVTLGPRRGYVERRYNRGGREYMRRTYVHGGRTYAHVYRPYYYRGAAYYRYVPAYYYRPVYYGWAYNPWASPVYYRWGWYGDPWYQPYGNYFSPYAVYPSAAFWLTDYLIAENLRAAYESQLAANAAASAQYQEQPQGGSVTLTPEVKQLVADEVKRQLAAEQQAASRPNSQSASDEDVPPSLDPNHRVFVVSSTLDVPEGDGSCALTPGDVIMRLENVAGDDNAVAVKVMGSKRSDCSVGSMPRVQISDLEEMNSRFREQLDSGLKSLAEKQGKEGIPRGPAADPQKVPEGQAEADPTATSDLDQQQQEADQTEKDVEQESSDPDKP